MLGLNHLKQDARPMAKFVISSSVKRVGDHQFIACASAIPYDVDQRCGPDERTVMCESAAAARQAGLDLASELSYEINARGDRVVDIHIHS
jgi:hypothetical protein